MSQPWQTYFSGDSQITTLNSDIASNATDTALVATYQNDLAALYTSLGSAEATALATPNSTNLDAVVTARQNLDTKRMAYAAAATIADQAVNGQNGTIMTRTVPDVVAALTDAISKLKTEINVTIGYSSSISVANEALRNSLALALTNGEFFLQSSGSWKKPSDMQPAIDWLVN